MKVDEAENRATPSDSSVPTLRADLETILGHALAVVLPEAALARHVRLDAAANRLLVEGRAYDLHAYRRIFVVGGGKAARRTGAALAAILGKRITAGVLNVYREQAREPLDGIALFAADHPTPNEAGMEGARRMADLLREADAETLVIALISGGGSSLMALPVAEITLADYRAVNDLLLTVPATIDEINAVRKHLDPLKGGGLRKAARDAGAFISLVLSDVPVTKTGIADDPEVIASGPTVGDGSTFATARRVLTGHRLWERIPASVRDYLEANLGREEQETLPKDSPLLAADKSQYVIIADNDQAMEAAGEKARELGYRVRLVGCRTGCTADKIHGEVAGEIDRIWQAVAPELAASDQIAMAAFATDGVDGGSDLAGAVADEASLKQAEVKGIDYRRYLEAYDSASFFEAIGSGLHTGPTGTNVADIVAVLVRNPGQPERRLAFIFGGEATVKVALPAGRRPGRGGRNTHLALLAALKMAERRRQGPAGQ